MNDKQKRSENTTLSASLRNVQLTINRIETYDDVKTYLMGLRHINYFISCREKAPTTGKLHIHIYAQFRLAVRLSFKKLHGAHLEKCYGSAQQNIDYIKKTNKPEERGEIIDEWGIPMFKGGLKIEDVKKMTPEERDKNLPVMMYNTVRKIEIDEDANLTIKDFEKERTAYFIWGKPGVGKTTKAVQMIKEYMEKTGEKYFNAIKCVNDFFIGSTRTAKIALYDDFRDSHMPVSEFVNLIDYKAHTFNTKGGFQKNRYNLIIITSVQNPEEMYPGVLNREEPKDQWMRRLEIIHLE